MKAQHRRADQHEIHQRRLEHRTHDDRHRKVLAEETVFA